MLIETCIAIGLLLAVAYSVFTSNRTAVSNSSFSAASQLVDNFLENQSAAIRAATINADGSLVLPAFAANCNYNTTSSTLTAVTLATGSAFKADITTYRRVKTAQEGQDVWEYVIEASFARRLPLGSATNTAYLKSRSVTKVVPK